jgi:hypothetical protein
MQKYRLKCRNHFAKKEDTQLPKTELNYKPRIEYETRRHKKKNGATGEEFRNVPECLILGKAQSGRKRKSNGIIGSYLTDNTVLQLKDQSVNVLWRNSRCLIL